MRYKVFSFSSTIFTVVDLDAGEIVAVCGSQKQANTVCGALREQWERIAGQPGANGFGVPGGTGDMADF